MHIFYNKKYTFTLLKLVVASLLVLLAGCEGVKNYAIKKLVSGMVEEFVGPIPEYTHKAQKLQTIQVAMRDGVKLETRIFLPKGEGPWPTVLVRDPYMFSRYVTCEFYVRYGYACVHQDVRGRFDSEGEWYPVVNERDDGIDTLNWLLEQPWQNNNIGLMGESYLGLVQWSIADILPEQVKTMVVNVATGDMYDLAYYNGHFRHGIISAWSASMFAGLMEQEQAKERWQNEVIVKKPVSALSPEIFGEAWPSYKDYIENPDKTGAYWSSPFYKSMRNSYKSVDVPMMLTGRWYDFFLEGMIETYEGLPSRDNSLFLIGPGDHSPISYGELEVKDKTYQLLANTLKWFDHHLKGVPMNGGYTSGYWVYKNGQDSWQHYDSWPPQSNTKRLHLANIAASDNCDGGKLASLPASTNSAASYVYDPLNPVPTIGGSAVLSPDYAPTANHYIGNTICSRSDVLSFRSDAFAEPARIAGSININIDVSTDAEDTAFTVLLSEVFADGRVMNIRSDITSLLKRNGSDVNLDYRPGQTVNLSFDLAAIDWTLQPGSSLRLDISSSDFPAFHAHPNIKGLWSDVEKTITAKQTLHGGFVDLPITTP